MSPLKAVLFDRDGTLVHDVPYNGDPDRVRPVDGAREAVALLRAHGIRTGVVTNQSGIARGLVTDAGVRHVNRRVDDLLGPFDVWAVCPHGPDDGCHCRKPRPGLVLWAAGRICVHPADCVVIGDIGADIEAAERAGARGVLVPNDRTRPAETSAADHVAPDLPTAVRALLTADTPGQPDTPRRPDPGTPTAPDTREVPRFRLTADTPKRPDTPRRPDPGTPTAPDTPEAPRSRLTADTPTAPGETPSHPSTTLRPSTAPQTPPPATSRRLR
ncbi:HAD-IIIA family hydrolase [Streptomyces sp. NRRL F-5065]|uniref:D-glycero-alpha-D-manno-heptose-1,7-bisphosphate 7-phosphatase n=1 Tax=Streptomyces sp. NRRL F-5065 TaxID=1463855 RepID=UPI000B07F900